MKRRLIIYAPNVGVGGGLILLRALLAALPIDQSCVVIRDKRGFASQSSGAHNVLEYWVESSVTGRLRAEMLLSRIAKNDDIVLCFHNLPPVFPVKGRILCYVHNPNLVGIVPTSSLHGWVAIRYLIERRIAAWFGFRIQEYIVQTASMARALRRTLRSSKKPIHIAPFVDHERMPNRPIPVVPSSETQGVADSYNYDFVYISDGATHKNHAKLLAAWVLLAKEGLYPTLALTLHPIRDAELKAEIETCSSKMGLKIFDLGQMPHERVLSLYGKTKALLFPSYAESFGIPLVEAQAAGVPILAAELDFVRDICDPAVTFDPHSAVSIARSVRRFLGQDKQSREIPTASGFIALIQNSSKH